MSRLSFRDMPLSIKIVTGVAWFSAWVLFEEIVVDRTNLWHYMPFYRVGDYCVWDFTASVVILACLYVFGRPAATDR